MASFGQDVEQMRKIGNECKNNSSIILANYKKVGESINAFGKSKGSKAIVTQAEKEYMGNLIPNAVKPFSDTMELLGTTLLKISKDIEEIDN